MTITTTQLAGRVTRARRTGWTLHGGDLDAVVAAVQGDDHTIFADLVVAARSGDETAGEVLLWSVLPGLTRVARRRPSVTIDDLLGYTWLTLADVNLAAVPARRPFLDRVKRRVERAADTLAAHREQSRDPYQLDLFHASWFSDYGDDPADTARHRHSPLGSPTGEPSAGAARRQNRSTAAWDDPTSSQATERVVLGELTVAVADAIADRQISPDTWRALVDHRVHGISYAARDPRDASAMTSRVWRATHQLRHACHLDHVA